MATAVYPGRSIRSHKGHLDIIKRAAKINDHLIVAVLTTAPSIRCSPWRSGGAMLQECCKASRRDGGELRRPDRGVRQERHASVMVRGLRAVTDFENEIQLAQTNHALMPGIETMFLATSIKWSYLSSTIVKEAAYYGSDISKFVTPSVEKAVNEKYALIRQKKDSET